MGKNASIHPAEVEICQLARQIKEAMTEEQIKKIDPYLSMQSILIFFFDRYDGEEMQADTLRKLRGITRLILKETGRIE